MDTESAPSRPTPLRRLLGDAANLPVFVTSAVLVVALAVFGVVAPDAADRVFGGVQGFIVDELGWFYSLVASCFLVFVLWTAFGRYGNVRLGPDDARPDYGYVTWFAMLFSAGMGIGVLFWSVAEPLNHFATPPYGDAETPAAAQRAVNLTFLHWGLHGWAIYAVVGLVLAYVVFRRGLPMAMRSTLQPLLGDRVYGPAGHAIDVFAILGTMFGVATTLGIGAQQGAAGLAHLFDLEATLNVQLWIIALATAAALVSVISGLDRGIKRLSQTAFVLGLVVLAYVLLLGPTGYALTATVESIGRYVQTLPETALRGTAYADPDWMADWTLFYWGWWLAWSPFVGIFIARVSRGRTIREFVLGVLFVPTLVIFLWYGVFGHLALQRVLAGDERLLDTAIDNLPAAIFVFFEAFPLSTVVSLVGLVVIAVYFVTSSDSASFVIDMLASGGDLDPPRRTRVFWAVAEGLVGAMLLVAGGLQAMRTFQITTGLPLALLLIGMCVAMTRALRTERRHGTAGARGRPESDPHVEST
ncbi:BCCT family transporter [Egicoccus halophilus]|uniref:Choline/glycine/proline betaine transport protein n=1 Tax=Egicoccus halophilus TaxID=1670830 RepID=A0A8J3AGZ6_9ACTN|nr:BCCT family transporter [Egicoccus halophilus]GGI09429.1 hypothetical protein GCM10011354_34030 [Egicoccus halophilus]